MGRPLSPLLSVDRIVTTAMAIVETEGMAALTIRRLSRELGTGPASLYNHIIDRDQLLDLLVAAVMDEIDLRPIERPDLREAVVAQAEAFLLVLRRHPQLAETIAIRPVRSARSLAYYEAVLGRLRDAGLSPPDAIVVLYAIDDYALGAALNKYDHIDLGDRKHAYPLLAEASSASVSPDYQLRALRAIVERLIADAVSGGSVAGRQPS